MSWHRSVLLPAALAAVLSLLMTACASSDEQAGMPMMDVAYDTIADTVFVYTRAGRSWPGNATLVAEVVIGELDGPEEYIFGSIASIAVGPAGEIFVMDQQVPALRVYEPDGTYRTTFGREGSGPGEYKRPDGGMVVIGDRLVLRDPSNARMTVYDMAGELVGNWLVNGGFSTSSQMPWDLQGNVYTFALKNVGVPVEEWESVLVRYDAEGVVRDSLGFPVAEIPKGVVEGHNENSSSMTSVPFFPNDYAVFSPLGYFVQGVNTRYGVKLLRQGEPHLVFGREYEPVPIPRAYAAFRKDQITRNFRGIFPGWRWNGPEIPDVMPPFGDISVGIDGRIWVSLNQPMVEEDNPDFDPAEEDSQTTRWRTSTVYDLFDTDGTYLGQVTTPDDFRDGPDPIFGTDWVVATTRDELGVQRVVRYRIEIAGPATD